MERQALAVEGAPPTGMPRVELARLPDPEVLRLVPAQEDGASSLARVWRGYVRLGRLAVPAAIKVQRPAALTGEEHPLASAKLDSECALHDLLCPAKGGEAARLPLVQVLPVGEATGPEAGVLPPSILCARGRHALAPRCPRDGNDLHAEELVGSGETRCLVCPACGSRQDWDGPGREEVLRASVRRDPACVGCPHQGEASPDACLRQAAFLNPLPSRVVVLKAWDADLGDFLRWRQGEEAPPDRPRAWAPLEEHRRCARRETPAGDEEEEAARPVRELRETVALFGKILDAAERLHGEGVALLDLHPGCLVLSLHGAEIEVFLADLCRAHHADTPLAWRQLQLQPPHTGYYAAPECQSPASTAAARSARWRGDVCELVVEWTGVAAADRLESPFCVGDWFAVQHAALERDRFAVEAVRESAGRWHVIGRRTPAAAEASRERQRPEAASRERQRPEAASRERQRPEEDWQEAADVEVFRHKHCGAPADVFSLGMLLLALLCPGGEALASYRRALAGMPWQTLLPSFGPEPESAPPGDLVRALLERKAPGAGGEAAGALLADFLDCEAHLDRYAAARPAAQELFGIVLRATLRGGSGAFYLADRGGDARQALRRMRVDLERAAGALREAPRPLLPREAFVFVLTRPPFVQAFRASWSAAELSADSRERWRQQHEDLWQHLCRFDDALRRIEECLAETADHLRELLPPDPACPARPDALAPLIACCEAMAAAIGVLEEAGREEVSRHPEALHRLVALAERRERHFGPGGGAGGPAAKPFRALVEEYHAQWEQKCRAWRTWFANGLASLKDYVEAIRTQVIAPWEEARSKKTRRKWPWRPQAAEGIPVTLAGGEGHLAGRAAAALDLLRECSLGPGAEVEAALAMLTFEEMRSSRPATLRLRKAA
jgi:hypothetical protein